MKNPIRFLTLLLVSPLWAAVANAQVDFTPVAVPTEAVWDAAPAFVQEVRAPLAEEAELEAYGGVVYLLTDTQHDARGEEPVNFRRIVREARNISGVEEVAQQQIVFDPSFQRLVFHHVYITRDGERTDRRDSVRVDFARQETEFDRLMLNGQVTALMRLDDVRVGDVVDVAYTIYGSNPVFDGQDFREFTLRWAVPVERLFVRSLWTDGDVGYWDVFGGQVDVSHQTGAGFEEFRYDGLQVEALDPESGAPSWHYQYPALRITGFDGWQDVTDWAEPIFNLEPNAAVRSEVERIRARHETPEDQLLAALRFVQDEVRYLALSFGQGGYVPASPDQTLQTRFGDCKAKTVLFNQMARELGFTADPALVNLYSGRGLDNYMPSPGGFDHVITRLRHDGETYWVDPTNSHQGGTLAALTQADYGWALPLTERGEGLVSMAAERDAEGPSLIVREEVDLSGGRSAPIRLSVETVRTRDEADFARAVIAEVGRSGLQRNYLDFYNGAFGDSEFVEPLRYEDDRANNQLTVWEEVDLHTPYEDGATPSAYSFNFFAHALTRVVENDAERRRVSPLAVGHPFHIRHEITIKLTNGGRNWDLENESERIENSAFEYSYTARRYGDEYRMVYEMKSLGHVVPSDAASEVLREQDDMMDAIFYGFDMTEPRRRPSK